MNNIALHVNMCFLTLRLNKIILTYNHKGKMICSFNKNINIYSNFTK